MSTFQRYMLILTAAWMVPIGAFHFLDLWRGADSQPHVAGVIVYTVAMTALSIGAAMGLAAACCYSGRGILRAITASRRPR
jgi:hypothetical protein